VVMRRDGKHHIWKGAACALQSNCHPQCDKCDSPPTQVLSVTSVTHPPPRSNMVLLVSPPHNADHHLPNDISA
jgi:hypothetical protein